VARTGRDLDPGAHCLEAVALDHERVAPRSDAGKREAPIGTGHRRVRGAFEPDTGVGYRLAGFLRDDASDDLGGRLRECGCAPQVQSRDEHNETQPAEGHPSSPVRRAHGGAIRNLNMV